MSEEQGLSLEAIDTAIRRLRGTPPEQAARDLTAIANRAIIELHNVARTAANERRGAPDWGQWARLANAARSGVLQIAAVRDTLKGMSPPTPSSETKDE